MNNRNLVLQLLDSYNEELGTDIRIVDDVRGRMTPETVPEEQTVTYNPHIDTLFLLFNVAKMHKSAGSHAIHHFLLYHLALEKDLYQEAEILLQEFEADLATLLPAIPSREIPLYKVVSDYQTVFVLAHEFSHVYYHLHPSLLQENLIKMKEHLVWLYEELYTDKPLLLKMLHLFMPKVRYMQEHCFDEVIASADLQEELLCDEAAWHMTHNLIKAGTDDVDIRASLSAFVAYTLYHVESQRTLENIYSLTDNAERQRHLIFDSTRSTVLTYTIWDDVEEDAKEAVSIYKSLINELTRSTRLHQMLSLYANAEHIAIIRNMQRGSYSPKELKRLDARYEEVVAGIGIQ